MTGPTRVQQVGLFLVLTALAVQMLLDGVRTFAHELAHLG